MTDNNNKKSHVTSTEEDRISNLPDHFIDSILERVPIEDALRTSILSKKWRYKWTTLNVLNFCEPFSRKYGPNGSIKILKQILTLHKGPILNFHLRIPKLPLDSFQEVDECMLLLSRKGATDVMLSNSNGSHYQLPSDVLFSCQELKTLKLHNFLFKPPLEFKGSSLYNIEHLHLSDVDFGDSLWSNESINLPKLKNLTMCVCKNTHNFNINATNLEIFGVCDFHDVRLLRFFNNPCLTRVHISSRPKPKEDLARVEKTTFSMMLSNLPKIKHFLINNHFLKAFTADIIPKWLPHPLNCLEDLLLRGFQLGNLDDLNHALFLVRNSPNLKELCMIQDEMQPVVDVGPALNHLESPNCLDSTLSRLESVDIKFFEGSKPELLFIKLLLAHSPSLKKLTITPIDVEKTPIITKDVMEFPRASPNAEMVYLNPPPKMS